MSGTDFHQHVWPDAFVRRLRERRSPPCLRGRVLTVPVGGSFELDVDAYAPEERLAELDRHELSRAVVSLAPTTEPTSDLVEIWHEEARALSVGSGGRLIPLAYEAAAPGFHGAVIGAPGFASRRPDAQRLLAALERKGMLAFVHPAATEPGSPGWFVSGVDYTQQMLAAYARWVGGGAQRNPRLRVVFALLAGGAPFQIERLVRRGLDARRPFATHSWFDTSSYGERALELSLQTFGVERLVFGSDAPVDTVRDARTASARFGSALEHALVVSNADALLTLAEDRWAA